MTSLPTPDAASSAHSERVAAYIRERIDAGGGSLSFADYMHHALYAPGLGYYVAGAAKLGGGGDFVTAPEISPLFARVLARQVAPVLEALGGGAILELGAGSGRLAIDLLQALERLDALPDTYLVLEVSADLAARQAALFEAEIPALAGRIRPVDRLPAGHRGVIIANEVLDALPVERFVRRNGIREQRVTYENGRFRFVEAAAAPRLAAAVEAIEHDLGAALPEGYVSERSPGLGPFVAEIAASLAAGIALLFDYGLARREYYAAGRSGGWLRCHFRHRAHDDPFLYPGIQDITAWVDFTAVAAAAVDAGARIEGYVNQALFLAGGGLEHELADIASRPARERAALSAAVKMLTLPGEMGENFKCMALGTGSVATPGAFGFADRTHTL